MFGNLIFDVLKIFVFDGEIDMVFVCIIDMQGCLMGKCFYVQYFVDFVYEEIYCCNYLLVMDFEMYMVEGFVVISWFGGYGDYVMKLDFMIICCVFWFEGMVMVICDVQDYYIYQDVLYFLCVMFKVQVVCMQVMGLMLIMVIELEFFFFEKSFDEVCKGGFCDLELIFGYNEDYYILQIIKEEDIMCLLCNSFYGVGILIENIKGEVEVG